MYPQQRMRRRRGRIIGPLLIEHGIQKRSLIAPLFVDETIRVKRPIGAMPGQFRYPVEEISTVASHLYRLGIGAVLLFGIPAEKDTGASGSYAEKGIIQRAVRAIKKDLPDFAVITDICACEYTSHGHCGIVGETRLGQDLLNDESLELMKKIAVSHAKSGADIVAPSCMLDGMVASIRAALDGAGYEDVAIMSYSTKFASALYGPFREAADSGFSFGDRSSYQLNPANGREAYLESVLDAEEGADILMVKPAGNYLDVLAGVREIGLPVAAFQVSGEYSQIKAAAERGWINERQVVLESLTCMKRAGADIIITYFAEAVAGWLDEK